MRFTGKKNKHLCCSRIDQTKKIIFRILYFFLYKNTFLLDKEDNLLALFKQVELRQENGSRM